VRVECLGSCGSIWWLMEMWEGIVVGENDCVRDQHILIDGDTDNRHCEHLKGRRLALCFLDKEVDNARRLKILAGSHLTLMHGK